MCRRLFTSPVRIARWLGLMLLIRDYVTSNGCLLSAPCVACMLGIVVLNARASYGGWNAAEHELGIGRLIPLQSPGACPS